MKLVIEDAIITQSYYSEKSGTLFFSVTDRDTGAQLDLTSEHMSGEQVSRYLDERVKAEMNIKITKFQNSPRIVVLSAQFVRLSDLEAAKAKAAPQPAANGKVPA